jgi:hypothetical protein
MGDMDLVVASDVDDEILWFENTGSGWTTHTIAGFADGAIGLALGDVNGDGSLDVVGGMRDGDKVRWWSNDNGDGSAWTMELIASSATGVTDVEVGDIDADGDLDVVAAVTGAGEIRWWQQGSGGWTARVLASNASGVDDIALGDADGDGYLDVFSLVPGFSRISWWENPRPGPACRGRASTWRPKTIRRLWRWWIWTATGCRRHRREPAPGHAGVVGQRRYRGGRDVDAHRHGSGGWIRTRPHPWIWDLDGDLDVVVTGDGGTVSWVENSSGGAGWTWRQITTATPAFGATAADLDLDGDPDVAWADPSGGRVETSTNLLNHRGALFNDGYIGVGGVAGQMLKPPVLVTWTVTAIGMLWSWISTRSADRRGSGSW